MKNIIVPTDFSDSAWVAFQFAIQLAKKNNIKILVINTFVEPHSGITQLTSLEKMLREDSEKGLEKWEQKIKEGNLDNDLSIKLKSVYGNLVDVLEMYTTNYDDQVIVMGSLGETGFIEKFIGSNATDVVDNVQCPIFVIPSNTKNIFPNNIAVAANFSESTRPVDLNILSELKLINDTNDLNIVHINKEESIDHIDFSLDLYLKDISYKLKVISDNAISKGLSKYVRDSKVDLLVLVKKKKGLFERIFNESITKELTLYAKIPLLILKPKS